jgi:hypothetical protein
MELWESLVKLTTFIKLWKTEAQNKIIMISRFMRLTCSSSVTSIAPRFVPSTGILWLRAMSTAGGASAKSEAISSALDEDLDDAEELSPHLRGEAPKIRERVVDDLGRGYGTGRRKTSIARVWVSEGSGVVSVNDRSVIDYFDQSQREHSLSVFMHTKTSGFFDVWATVKGGGKMGEFAKLLCNIIVAAS